MKAYATEAIIAQIERFAPGLRDRVRTHRAQHHADGYLKSEYVGRHHDRFESIRQLTFGPRSRCRLNEPGCNRSPPHRACDAPTPPPLRSRKPPKDKRCESQIITGPPASA